MKSSSICRIFAGETRHLDNKMVRHFWWIGQDHVGIQHSHFYCSP